MGEVAAEPRVQRSRGRRPPGSPEALATSWRRGSGHRPNALQSVRGPGVLCWFFLGFLRDCRSQHVFVPGGRKQSLSEGPFKSCVSSCREGGRGT